MFLYFPVIYTVSYTSTIRSLCIVQGYITHIQAQINIFPIFTWMLTYYRHYSSLFFFQLTVYLGNHLYWNTKSNLDFYIASEYFVVGYTKIYLSHPLFIFFLKIYLFMAALGLYCYAWVFSSCREQGYSLAVVCRLLISMPSLVMEHRLLSAQYLVIVVHGLSCHMVCGIFPD